LLWTTGWDDFSANTGLPVVVWRLPKPVILTSGPSFGLESNTFGFIISWATNASVTVEACTNLASPVWFPIATNNLANGSFYFRELLQTNSSGRFYRISSP
jgi:hypothetical protein